MALFTFSVLRIRSTTFTTTTFLLAHYTLSDISYITHRFYTLVVFALSLKISSTVSGLLSWPARNGLPQACPRGEQQHNEIQPDEPPADQILSLFPRNSLLRVRRAHRSHRQSRPASRVRERRETLNEKSMRILASMLLSGVVDETSVKLRRAVAL